MKEYCNTWISIEAHYLFRKAMELSDQGKYEAALNHLRHVLILTPRFTRAVHEMGNCLATLGRYDEAIERYDMVLKIDPGDAGALSSKGTLLQKIKQGKEGYICTDLA